MSLTVLPDDAAAVPGVLCRAGDGVVLVHLVDACISHCACGKSVPLTSVLLADNHYWMITAG